MRECPFCHAQMDADETFCPECGSMPTLQHKMTALPNWTMKHAILFGLAMIAFYGFLYWWFH